MPRNSVFFFKNQFAEHAQRVFLRDVRTEKNLSYADVDAASRGIASFLRGQGCEKGAPVAFSMDNSIELALFYFACIQLGCPILPVNPNLPADDMAELLGLSGVKTLVVSPSVLSRRANLVSRIDNIICVRPGGDDKDASLSTHRLETILRENDPLEATEDVSDADPLLFIPSSGTSGRPKILELDWRSLIGNAVVFSEFMGITPEHRFYNILPMTYLGGIFNLLLLPAANGASVAINALFGGGVMYSFWADVRKHGVNTLWFTATMLNMLLEIDDGEDVSFLQQQIRLGLVGMAPLPPAVKERFETRFPIRLHENFALSETLFLTSERPGLPRKTGGSGRALPGITVSIVNGAGNSLPRNQDGEILIHTPFRARRYRVADAPDHDRLLPDGGMLTGDVGHMDGDGELFVTGRTRDLIIRGGINVTPKAIENVLAAHPAVSAVAVVGIPSDIYGEDIGAAVVLSEGVSRDHAVQELTEHCAARLPRHQCPCVIRFFDALPLGVTGKVLKREIRKFFL